jgi:16S rRNA (cytidine1402-2'-O)-methyltransferase
MSETKTSAGGRLYLVATPIGNLEDVTLRALRILSEVSAIACEDTRQTRKLLDRHGIARPLVSYHEHNERERSRELVERMEGGESVALVSDAGMPLVSDPGHKLVELCIERGISVTPIPGPSAFVAALAASGLPAEEFLFIGFLPARAGERSRKLGELASEHRTLIFYEAPHRLAATLRDALAILGDRRAVVARELTKIHEEFRRATLVELAEFYGRTEPRGEITLLVGASETAAAAPEHQRPRGSLAERVAEIERQGKNHKSALKQAAREFGIPKREAYRLLLAEQAGRPDGRD